MRKIENTLYKFSGAGNDFVVLDGRGVDASPFRDAASIRGLCREFSTDGLMILGEGNGGYDFSMEFFNPDGTGGMMCGNGGRCIVAFADYLGIRPAAEDGIYRFMAPDGPHTGEILSKGNAPSGAFARTGSRSDAEEGTFPSEWTVKIRMKDVDGISPVAVQAAFLHHPAHAGIEGLFLNTGTRHFVIFVEDVDSINIEEVAPPVRYAKEFAPEGTNVNFVEKSEDGLLKVRTFEKGVEGETLACGTGITASAIATYFAASADPAPAENCGSKNQISAAAFLRHPSHAEPSTPAEELKVRLQCRRGDILTVEFRSMGQEKFTDVYLTGPAEMVKIMEI